MIGRLGFSLSGCLASHFITNNNLNCLLTEELAFQIQNNLKVGIYLVRQVLGLVLEIRSLPEAVQGGNEALPLRFQKMQVGSHGIKVIIG